MVGGGGGGGGACFKVEFAALPAAELGGCRVGSNGRSEVEIRAQVLSGAGA
jgi:hypothetical protein